MHTKSNPITLNAAFKSIQFHSAHAFNRPSFKTRATQQTVAPFKYSQPLANTCRRPSRRRRASSDLLFVPISIVKHIASSICTDDIEYAWFSRTHRLASRPKCEAHTTHDFVSLYGVSTHKSNDRPSKALRVRRTTPKAPTHTNTNLLALRWDYHG